MCIRDSDERASLQRHTLALFGETAPELPRPLDQSFITRYQTLLATTPADERAYGRIKQLNSEQLRTPISLTALAGKDVARVFDASQEQIKDNLVPAFFTIDGFQQHFTPASNRIAETLAADSWVLGDTAAEEDTEEQFLKSSVTRQYYACLLYTSDAADE